MQRFVGFAVVIGALAIAIPAHSQNKPLLAVMDIQDRTGALSAEVIDNLTEYLRGLLAESGKYTVIDRSRQAKAIKDVLQKERKETHKACYERSCQVPVGRILAADQVLVTTFMKVGSQFMLKAEILRLDTEASSGGATARGDFDPKQGLEDRVIEALDTVAGKIAGQALDPKKSKAEATAAVEPVNTTPTPKAGWQSPTDKLEDKAELLQIRAERQKKAWERLKTLEGNDRLPLKERLSAIDDFSGSLESGSSYKQDARKLRVYVEARPEYYRTKTEWVGLHLSAGTDSDNAAVGGYVSILTLRWPRFYLTALEGKFLGSIDYGKGSSAGIALGWPIHLGERGIHELRLESGIGLVALQPYYVYDVGPGKFEGIGVTPRLLYVNHFSGLLSFVGGIEMVIPVIPLGGDDFIVVPTATVGLKFGK